MLYWKLFVVMKKFQWSLCQSLLLRVYSSSSIKKITVECRYNAVWYSMILHTALQELRQNINQRLNPQNTPHTSTWRSNYRVYFMNMLEKTDRVITAPHCTTFTEASWHRGFPKMVNYSDVLWTFRRLKSPANRLFLRQLLLQTDSKENIKSPHYSSFVNRIHRPFESPPSGSAMQEAFPRHAVLIRNSEVDSMANKYLQKW